MIGHKEYPPDGLYEQYKLSIELIPLDDNVELDDASEGLGSAAYHPSKSLEKSNLLHEFLFTVFFINVSSFTVSCHKKMVHLK